MKKILVTGGAGFIGSNFIKYISKTHPEYNIVNLDKVTNDYNCENLRYVKGDISDRNFIFNLFEKEKFDIVVNCAFEKNYNEETDDKSIFTVTNIIGTQALLDASRECGIKKYHQVSTSEVYEDLNEVKVPSYTASRIASDKLVLVYKKEYNLNATISRTGEIQDIEFYCVNIDNIIHNGVSGEIYDI